MLSQKSINVTSAGRLLPHPAIDVLKKECHPEMTQQDFLIFSTQNVILKLQKKIEEKFSL